MKKWKCNLLTVFVILLNCSVVYKGLTQSNNVLSNEEQLFLDSLITAKQQEYNVPGLTIGLVLDSTKIFYDGYGLSDMENEIYVEGESTGFKIASITKTFTAISIMQLYERGEIELHKDINTYLPNSKFEFLNQGPITIHQLLTHTAGFDLTDINDAAINQADIEPLIQTINLHMPERIHSAGEVHSYSNFGYALLGYIIEQVSGLKYDEYLQKEIFTPLNMEQSSVVQPLPKILEDRLSKSYFDNTNKIHQRDYTKVAPADGIISTAKDMSNYMMALLHGGKFEDNHILGEEAFSLLTSQQYGSNNTRRGICYSFFEGSKNGFRSLEHTGGALGFASIIILIPESGTGLFISQNKRKGAQDLRYDVTKVILDRYLTAKKKVKQNLPEPTPKFENKANKYIGYYRQINYSHSTFEKITQLFGMNNKEYEVSYRGDNFLTINDLRFIPLSDTRFIFDNPETNWEIEFETNNHGKVNGLFNNTTIYKRIYWFERNIVKSLVGGFSLLLLLLNFITTTFFRVRNAKNTVKSSKINYLYLMSYMILLSVVFFGITLAIYGDQLTDYGIPLMLRAALLFSSIVAIISIYSPLYLFRTLRSNKSKLSQVWEAIVTISIAIIMVYFWHYNLIGFQF